MKALEEKILKDGKVLPGNILKVGSFLNQQLDVEFLKKIGEEIKNIYGDCSVTKILTIEASGIAIAVAAGMAMGVPAVFAKKGKSANVSGDVYKTEVYSYTHKESYNVVVPKEYLTKDDCVVIVDDFLANGKALEGLIDIVEQSGAKLAGCTCAVEKGFQGGGDTLREKGVRIESLARIASMSPENGIEFID